MQNDGVQTKIGVSALCPERTPMQNDGVQTKIGVIGSGLIGGSILKTLHSAQNTLPVSLGVHDIDPTLKETVREHNWVWLPSITSAVLWSDVLWLASPPETHEEIMGDINRALHLRTGKPLVISDVASYKKRVVDTFEKFPMVREHCEIIPGHPMAGSEHHGFSASTQNLFQDKTWVLTRDLTPNMPAFFQVAKLVFSMGAKISVLPADLHDRAVTQISPAPYALSIAAAHLVETSELKNLVLRLAAGSFSDVSRVAGSPIELSAMLLTANPDLCTKNIDQLIETLQTLRDAISSEDKKLLETILQTARTGRKNFIATKSEKQLTHTQISETNALPALEKLCSRGALIEKLTWEPTTRIWRVTHT